VKTYCIGWRAWPQPPFAAGLTFTPATGTASSGSHRRNRRLAKELEATLADVEAMAHLGRYYADKIRGAAELAVFRADRSRGQARDRAVRHLEHAVTQWEAYARVAASRYRPQLLARTHYLDWNALLADVKKEVAIARR